MTQDSLSSEALEMKSEFVDVETSLEEGTEEDATKELGEGLLGRVVASFRYLRSKAKFLTVPGLTDVSLGSNQLEQEVGSLVSEVDSLVVEDGDVYSLKMLESMQMVMDVLESLVRRVTLAESETSFYKERVILGEEEMRRKTIQIDHLSLKLEEIKTVVRGHKTLLDEATEAIEKLVEDNRRDSEKALENEEELRLMKTECEELRNQVNTSINVIYEQQFQTIEAGLVAKSTKLEGEKAQKEIEVQKLTEEKAQKEKEVQKLMEENMKLATLLDKKEAHISALNEQCKFMALNASNI